MSDWLTPPNRPQEFRRAGRRTRVLILGANCLVGRHLAARLVSAERFEVLGIDDDDSQLRFLQGEPGFDFDISSVAPGSSAIDREIGRSDVVVPLIEATEPDEEACRPVWDHIADIAAAQRTVRFATLLHWIYRCAADRARLLVPSIPHAMESPDEPELAQARPELAPENGHGAGPRSPSQQLLHRVLWQYAERDGLRFVLFRPINWIGSRLDGPGSNRVGSSRVVARFVHDLMNGEPLLLDGASNRLTIVTDAPEGVECLRRIIDDAGGICDRKTFTIANGHNRLTTDDLARLIVANFERHELRAAFPRFAGYVRLGSAVDQKPVDQVVVEHGAVGPGAIDRTDRDGRLARIGRDGRSSERAGALRTNAEIFLDWHPDRSMHEAVRRTVDDALRGSRAGAAGTLRSAATAGAAGAAGADIRPRRSGNVVQFRHAVPDE